MSYGAVTIVLLSLIVVTEILVIWLVFFDPRLKNDIYRSLRWKATAILKRLMNSVTSIIAVLSLLVLLTLFLLVISPDIW